MNRATLAIIAAAFASGVLGYVLSRHWAAPPAPPPPVDQESVIGAPAPEFSFPDLAGNQRSLGEFEGRVRVVNFWATWCAPCRREMPALDALQRRLSARGLTVIGIALDEPEPVAEFVAELDLVYPIVVPEAADGMRYLRALGNVAGVLPYTVFIGRDGRVEEVKVGELSAEEGLSKSSRLL